MIRAILLSRHMVAIVDVIDYEYLKQWKWYADKQRSEYRATRSIRKDGKRITQRMHQVVAERMGIDSPSIDHINRDQLDNRRLNLRAATDSQQQHNQGMQSDNNSGYIGVCWEQKSQKWKSQIQHKCKDYFLGYFDDKRQAYLAYACAKIEYAGEFVPKEIQSILEGFNPLEIVTFMATHAESEKVDIRYLLSVYPTN